MLPFVAGGHLFINVENEAAGGERGRIKLDDSAKIKTEKRFFVVEFCFNLRKIRRLSRRPF